MERKEKAKRLSVFPVKLRHPIITEAFSGMLTIRLHAAVKVEGWVNVLIVCIQGIVRQWYEIEKHLIVRWCHTNDTARCALIDRTALGLVSSSIDDVLEMVSPLRFRWHRRMYGNNEISSTSFNKQSSTNYSRSNVDVS